MNKELREKMVKQAKVYAEKAKVGIRKVRQKAITDIRKENVSEDTTRKIENHVSSATSSLHVASIDKYNTVILLYQFSPSLHNASISNRASIQQPEEV